MQAFHPAFAGARGNGRGARGVSDYTQTQNSRQRKCGNCDFFYPWKGNSAKGECRRHTAPTGDSHRRRVWYNFDAEDWCGDFEPRE